MTVAENLARGISVSDDFKYVRFTLEFDNALELLAIVNHERERRVKVDDKGHWFCPECEKALDFNNRKVGRCSCGQRLKWEE